MISPLLDCFPQPMPVRIAGRDRLVSQLQLRHLAELDRWLVVADGEPATDTAMLDDAERRALLRAQCVAAEQLFDRCPFETDDGRTTLFDSVSGAATFLLMALRDEQPAPTAEEAAELAAIMTGAEWEAVDRVALAIDRVDETTRAIDHEIGIEWPKNGDSTSTRTWRHTLAEFCRELPWCSPAVFGDLYLSQFYALQTGGKIDRGTECPGSWTREQFIEAQGKRKAFWDEGTTILPPVETSDGVDQSHSGTRSTYQPSTPA